MLATNVGEQFLQHVSMKQSALLSRSTHDSLSITHLLSNGCDCRPNTDILVYNNKNTSCLYTEMTIIYQTNNKCCFLLCLNQGHS